MVKKGQADYSTSVAYNCVSWATDVELSTCLPFPPFFTGTVFSLCFDPCLVSVFLPGSAVNHCSELMHAYGKPTQLVGIGRCYGLEQLIQVITYRLSHSVLIKWCINCWQDIKLPFRASTTSVVGPVLTGPLFSRKKISAVHVCELSLKLDGRVSSHSISEVVPYLQLHMLQ